ncbi:MAG: YgfZ/GcvT domain-containing protein [Burkholderiales bacterium]
MNTDRSSIWLQFLHAQGFVIKDNAAEISINHESAGTVAKWTPLLENQIISVAGKDAESFLNSLLSCDVTQVKMNSAVQTGLCNAKGRLIAAPFLTKDTDAYRLVLPSDISEDCVKTLQKYKLRSKVDIELAGNCAIVGIIHNHEGQLINSEHTWLGAMINERRSIIYGDVKRIIGLIEISQDLRPVSSQEWVLNEIRDYQAQISKPLQEIFIPQAIHLERNDGISFTKGCYPGQEIVARTKYLGTIKRQLYQFSREKPSIAGELITNIDGQNVGVVVSNAKNKTDGYVGLAVMIREQIKELPTVFSDFKIFDRLGK